MTVALAWMTVATGGLLVLLGVGVRVWLTQYEADIEPAEAEAEALRRIGE